MTHLIDWQHIDQATWEGRIETALRFGSLSPGQVAIVARSRPAIGRALGLLFFNPSLRTRTSMEVAASRLGATSSVIVPGQGTWGFAWEDGGIMDGAEAEHIQEAAGVLSQYFDSIGVRLFASLSNQAADREERHLNRFVRAATSPVINLESAYYHPCQALADAAVMTEHFGDTPADKRFVLSWAYHPKALPTAVPNSALLSAARLGMQVTIARPDGFELDPQVMNLARTYTTVEETNDQAAALDGAHVVYAKAWAGGAVYDRPEEEAEQRKANQHWRITQAGMGKTDSGVFMHCLPVRRGVVVDGEVLDGPRAIHLRQAAYRLYAQQSILSWLWDLPDDGLGALSSSLMNPGRWQGPGGFA